ncbi:MULTISPECIES: phage tail protein [Dickeya]|uniref:Phage tail fiber protein n=1 Tax=Dickeya aquatica TaxID=1401087 RepID=A0A375A5G6_9GAMM|nr:MULTISPECIES: phage tail protein [Dickeya]SLM61280.1 Phage tail fiber protein [Dickeya aquatica]
MSAKYTTLLTQVGENKLAKAIAQGRQLAITQMGVGDGGGVLPAPTLNQTMLINEKRRAPLNTLSIDPTNPRQIIAEQVIPENEGGFWLREIGLYDADGDLIAVANCPETYKPQLQEGSGRVQTVRVTLAVSQTSAVSLSIDATVVFATRSYVDNALANHEKSRKHPNATLTAAGLAQLSNAIDSDSETLAATPKAVKAANDNANGRVPSLRQVNGKALSADIILNAADVGAISINEMAGIPLPWPQANAPAGWLKCNGQAFDKALYPKLAQIYPSGSLPDLRGEFIRGWDDGRGVDAGRTIGSWQESTKISGYVGNDGHGSLASGVVEQDIAEIHATYTRYAVTTSAAFLGSNLYRVKPRNVAFNYIVRAA